MVREEKGCKGARHTLRAHTRERKRLFFIFFFCITFFTADVIFLFSKLPPPPPYYLPVGAWHDISTRAAVVWVDELTARAGAACVRTAIGVGEADIIPTHTRATAETTIIHGGRRVKAHLCGGGGDVIGALQMEGIEYICIQTVAAVYRVTASASLARYSTRCLAPVHHPPPSSVYLRNI